MATISAFSTPFSICRVNDVSSSLNFPRLFVRFRSNSGVGSSSPNLSVLRRRRLPIIRKIRSLAEEETLIPDEQRDDENNAAEGEVVGKEMLATDQTVSVPVSPSDVLTMFFQAEGTMNEAAIPTVTKALEETEGISTLKVQVLEGIMSVELTKQTTVQATGVASGLVEIIQSSGFKLQTLNLSFEDGEDVNYFLH